MGLIHRVLFAFVSGFSELLMVSADAHQMLYITVTGCDHPGAAFVLAIHLGLLGALWVCCRTRVKELRYERRLALSIRRRRTRYPDPSALMDMRIINTAAVPVLLGLLFKNLLPEGLKTAGWIALFLLLNSVVLYIPRLFSSGNKDSLSYTMFDGLLMGLFAALGIFPGISPLACLFSIGLLRGAEKKYSLELSLLILLPSTLGLIAVDAYGIAISGVALTALGFLGCVLGCVASFTGAYCAIRLLRYFCDRINTTCVAYYCGGLAVVQFLIYILIP